MLARFKSGYLSPELIQKILTWVVHGSLGPKVVIGQSHYSGSSDFLQMLHNCSLVSITWNRLMNQASCTYLNISTELQALTLLSRLAKPGDHGYQPRSITFRDNRHQREARTTEATVIQVLGKCKKLESLGLDVRGVNPYKTLQVFNLSCEWISQI